MTRHDQSEIGQALASVRKALLAGDLIELAGLSGRLEETVVQAMPKSLGEARLVKRMAEENDSLLVAALKGVRAARKRLHDLSEQGRFSTYQSNGQRHQPGLDSLSPARRL